VRAWAPPLGSGPCKGRGRTIPDDRRARTACRLSFEPLFLVDDARRFLDASDACGDLLRATVTDIRGSRIERFTPREDWPTLERLCGVLETRGSLAGPYVLLCADGSQRLVEFRAERDAGPGAHLISARDLREETGPGRPHRAGPRLTPRELEILQLAADGGTTRAMAEHLVLSPTTVKTHLEHAYEKLGVRDRAAAVAEALRLRLIH
jgi:DNA-binding CsgD family transcriptional regulator